MKKQIYALAILPTIMAPVLCETAQKASSAESKPVKNIGKENSPAFPKQDPGAKGPSGKKTIGEKAQNKPDIKTVKAGEKTDKGRTAQQVENKPAVSTEKKTKQPGTAPGKGQKSTQKKKSSSEPEIKSPFKYYEIFEWEVPQGKRGPDISHIFKKYSFESELYAEWKLLAYFNILFLSPKVMGGAAAVLYWQTGGSVEEIPPILPRATLQGMHFSSLQSYSEKESEDVNIMELFSNKHKKTKKAKMEIPLKSISSSGRISFLIFADLVEPYKGRTFRHNHWNVSLLLGKKGHSIQPLGIYRVVKHPIFSPYMRVCDDKRGDWYLVVFQLSSGQKIAANTKATLRIGTARRALDIPVLIDFDPFLERNYNVKELVSKEPIKKFGRIPNDVKCADRFRSQRRIA